MKEKTLATLVVMVSTALLASCAGMYGYAYRPGQRNVLKDERFAVTISNENPPRTEWRAKDYVFEVLVENVSSKDDVFDSSELEVKDIGTGLSYFSISKDKTLVSLPADRTDIITKVTLKPGQRVEGRLWFVTPDYKADAQKLELKMGNASATFER